MTDSTGGTDLDVVLDRATPADADVVDAMVREIAAHQDQLAAVRTTAARWAELLERSEVIVLVARRDGVPVGYVSAVRRFHLWTGSDVLALDDLYVRESDRGRGVGEVLMAELARRFAVPDGLTVSWGVEPGNEGAIRFYRRLGATLRPKVVAGWAPGADVVTTGGRAGPGAR